MKLPDSFPLTVKRGGSVVKIYRQERGKYTEFKVAYYLGGKRKLEVFGDYVRAKSRADEINGSVDGNLGGIALSKEECILHKRAVEALKNTGIELDTAAREYADARKLLGSVPLLDAVRDYVKRHPAGLRKATVQEICAELLADKKRDGLGDDHLKDLAVRLGKFSEAFHVNAIDLTADTVNEWLRSLENIGGRSRNNYRRVIGTFLRYAEQKRVIPKGHIPLEDIARAREQATRREKFTPEEMVRLLNAARPTEGTLRPGANRRYVNEKGLLPLVVLGGFAGIRTGREIRRQKMEDINLATGFIRVTGAKPGTAADRLIPISDNLRQWIELFQKGEEFCCTLARPEEALKRLAKRAGVQWKHNALRHSYGSYRTAVTQNVPQVALEMGNSVKMVNRHYRAVKTPEQGRAWFGIVPTTPNNVVPMAVMAERQLVVT